jgi:hypothetical protein
MYEYAQCKQTFFSCSVFSALVGYSLFGKRVTFLFQLVFFALIKCFPPPRYAATLISAEVRDFQMVYIIFLEECRLLRYNALRAL